MTISQVGALGSNGGGVGFGVQRLLSWSMLNCDILLQQSKGRPLLEIPWESLGCAKSRMHDDAQLSDRDGMPGEHLLVAELGSH
jgi:hypothetical protein